MQLDSLELFHVALPYKEPREIAGCECSTLDTVLVKITSGGTAGWGEASPGNAPLFCGEWATGAYNVLRDWLAPAVAGSTVDSGEALQERLKAFRGNQFAKAALDTAWWDLNARLQGKPLHEVIGGQRNAVEVGPTFDRMESADDFIAAIGTAFDAGYPRVKLKFRPGWDVEMLRFVRQHFPSQTFHIDVEGDLGLGYMEMFCRLDDFMLAMIEQPLPPDDLVGHAMVQETIRTPICLDEGIASVAQADMALDLKSCRFVNLKPGRVGGLTPAIAIHDRCKENDVACWAGAMPQSAIGARFALALAAKANCTYPADFFASTEVLAEDLQDTLLPQRGDDGVMRISLWSMPGIGIDPDPEMLEKFTLQQAKFEGM
jgi:o-succinylbenzoate synthase